MSHELFGERFIGYRQPAWHGLGQVTDVRLGALEAIEAAGADYMVHKVPLVARPGEIDGQSPEVPIPDIFAIMREPTPDDPNWATFGTAGPDYTILQNTDIASIIEPLAELWPVETVGVLKAGRTVFITLDAGSDDVRGEEVEKYFLITDTKDGGTSAKIAFTPVRVVCQNTLTSGLSVAMNTANIPHNPNIMNELNFRVTLIKKMVEAEQTSMAAFRQMAAVSIDEDAAKDIIAAAYTYPNMPARVELLEGMPEEDIVDLGTGAMDRYKKALERYEY